jgi:hypothetical protein
MCLFVFPATGVGTNQTNRCLTTSRHIEWLGVFVRLFGHAVILVCLTATLAGRDQPPARDPNAVLAAAREALGGEKRLAAIKTVLATGRTRQVRGDNLVPIEFEIAVELPDKYVRKDEIPAQESGVTSLGFNGDELIQLPPPPAPPAGAGAGAPNPAQLEVVRKARVMTIKQDFTRLMLGLFAGTVSSFPLTFTYVAQAEAPQGKADVVEAKGPGNFTARLFVNADTHLPIMVTWQAAGRGMPPGRGGPPGPGSVPPGPGVNTPPQSGAAAPPATPSTAAPPVPAGGAAPPPGSPAPAAGRGGAGQPPVENRLYFAEYRETDGLQLPYRIRRATGSDTTEETTFDRIKINGKVDPRKFEVRK